MSLLARIDYDLSLLVDKRSRVPRPEPGLKPEDQNLSRSRKAKASREAPELLKRRLLKFATANDFDIRCQKSRHLMHHET